MPTAPRARLDDLAQAFQPSSPFGQAGGVLPLAVWLDGDRSHGQGGTIGKASRARPMPIAPSTPPARLEIRARLDDLARAFPIHQGPSDRGELETLLTRSTVNTVNKKAGKLLPYHSKISQSLAYKYQSISIRCELFMQSGHWSDRGVTVNSVNRPCRHCGKPVALLAGVKPWALPSNKSF
ncbi:MAG: hypothetical protein WCI11_19830 [Candidatus Methylumidiphilus sp.]